MKLSIIIPIYNEEETIEQVINQAASVKLSKGINREIIVIDDGSTDNSKMKIKNSRFYKQIKLISHQKNMGKGAAIRAGITLSTGDLIIIQDADLEYKPIYYSILLEPVIDKNAPVVYGTRLLNYPLRLWGKDKSVLPIHLIANKILTTFTNLLYGSNLSDMETGYKLFKREVLESINITSNRFDFEPEVTVKILKRRIPITEVAISVKPRTYKEGKKIDWKDGLVAVWTLVKYKFID